MQQQSTTLVCKNRLVGISMYIVFVSEERVPISRFVSELSSVSGKKYSVLAKLEPMVFATIEKMGMLIEELLEV